MCAWDPAWQRRLWRFMASKTKVTPQQEEMLEKEGPETPPDSPPLDLSDAAVKKLISSAKKRGYVTHDQINALLSSEEVKSEQMEDILTKFSEMGINVVETEEAEPEDQVAREALEEEPESEDGKLVEVRQHRASTKAATKEPIERTDDPVSMYLREMGTELLSREGEIAIAKRIGAGREAMIAGFARARSPSRPSSSGGTSSTRERCFCAISSTSKRPMLGLTPKPCRPPLRSAPTASRSYRSRASRSSVCQPPRTPVTAPATPFRPAGERADGEETAADGTISESNLDDDDMENWLSVAAIEAELKHSQRYLKF